MVSDDNEIAIRVDNVSKEFSLPHLGANSVKSLLTGFYKKSITGTTERQVALKNISFQVKKGEFFGIVGRNGSGKSTLLKIIAGIYQPTQGKTEIKGKLVPFIELGVGFNPELTGRENVYLNGALLGFSKQEIDAMYEDIVAFAELERFMDQKLKNYSSGMQVRLAFSMATRSEADILLVDEVLAVGDIEFQRKCFRYFKTLKKNKKTVIFVSHDMEAVREYCDAAVLIEKSELVESGSAAKVANSYSKMFMQKKADKDNKQDRWGDGKAEISTLMVTPEKLEKDTKVLTIGIEVQAKEDIQDFNIGFGISDSMGNPLQGTNTKLMHVKTGLLKEGERLWVEFTTPNVFSDGDYTVNVAVVSDAGDVHDWWDEAKTFTAYQATPSNFLVSPPVSVSVTNRNST